MIFFRPLGFADPFAVIARLHKLKATFTDELVLKEAGVESEVFKGWMSLRRQLTEAVIARAVDVRIERLKAGSATEWALEFGPPIKIVASLVTNPLCFESVREERVHMPSGSIWQVKDCRTGQMLALKRVVRRYSSDREPHP